MKVSEERAGKNF